MLEGLFAADSLGRVERQQFAQKIQRLRIGLRERQIKRYTRFDRKRADVTMCKRTPQLLLQTSYMWFADSLLGSWTTNSSQGILRWRAKEIEDLIKLVDVVSTLEDGATAQQLCKDTSHRPHIDCKVK